MPSGRPSFYTPDHLIHFHGDRSSLWVEVKPKRHLRKKRAVWEAKFAAATAEAKSEAGSLWRGRDCNMRGPVLENAAFLRAFLQRPADADLQRLLLTKLEALQATTIKQLLDAVERIGYDRAHLLPQLATHRSPEDSGQLAGTNNGA